MATTDLINIDRRNVGMMDSYDDFFLFHSALLDFVRNDDESIMTEDSSEENDSTDSSCNSSCTRFESCCSQRSSTKDVQQTMVRDKESLSLPRSDISLTSHVESTTSSVSSLTASFLESYPISHAQILSNESPKLVKKADDLLDNIRQLSSQEKESKESRKYRTSQWIEDMTRFSSKPQSDISLTTYEESALTAIMNANRSMLRRYEQRHRRKYRISNCGMTLSMSSSTDSTQESSSLSHAPKSTHESSELVKEVDDLLDDVSETSSQEKVMTNKLKSMKIHYYQMKCNQRVNKARVNLKYRTLKWFRDKTRSSSLPQSDISCRKSRISDLDITQSMSSLTAPSQESQESSSSLLSPPSISFHEVDDVLDNLSGTSSRGKAITNKLRSKKMTYYHVKCNQFVKKVDLNKPKQLKDDMILRRMDKGVEVNLNEPKRFKDNMILRRMNKGAEVYKGSRKYRTSRWIKDTIRWREERRRENNLDQ